MGWFLCLMGEHRWSAGPIDGRYCLDCGTYKHCEGKRP